MKIFIVNDLMNDISKEEYLIEERSFVICDSNTDIAWEECTCVGARGDSYDRLKESPEYFQEIKVRK